VLRGASVRVKLGAKLESEVEDVAGSADRVISSGTSTSSNRDRYSTFSDGGPVPGGVPASG